MSYFNCRQGGRCEDCNGYIGPLDTYVCPCRCHGRDVPHPPTVPATARQALQRALRARKRIAGRRLQLQTGTRDSDRHGEGEQAMKTTTTTTYDYNKDGTIAKETVIREEMPDGDVLLINGLTDEQIHSLVTIRDGFQTALSL